MEEYDGKGYNMQKVQFDYKKFVDDFRVSGTLDVLCPYEKLQMLQDHFTGLTGFPAGVFAPDMTPYTVCDTFAADVLEDKKTVRAVKNEHSEPTYVQSGVYMLSVVPLVVKGKYFGSILVAAKNADDSVMERLKHGANLICETFNMLLLECFRSYEYQARLEVRRKHDEILEHNNEELRARNSYDELTGLRSRSYFNEQCALMEKDENPLLCIVMGDINDLKITNDLFGHRHGDILLKTIAQVMQEEALPGSIIARCGGDEFNVLMPRALRRDANWYCHEVEKRLKTISTCCTTPSISFGVGKRSGFDQSIKETINIADVKMYRNKVDYKNQHNIIEDIYSVLLRRGYLTDSYTERVERVGVGFCKYLSSDGVTISHMRILARIHELGATILPEWIYFKPHEERTLLEKREVHKHSDIGAKIAMLCSSTEPVADVILELHEQWNGRGYPRELKGAQIRPLARILQVVTEYSRMVEKSRMGWNMTKEQACEKLKEGAGTIFDPGMVNIFLNYLDTLEDSFL